MLCSHGWPATHYVDQAGLRLTEICLLLPPECWDLKVCTTTLSKNLFMCICAPVFMYVCICICGCLSRDRREWIPGPGVTGAGEPSHMGAGTWIQNLWKTSFGFSR